MNSKPVPFRTLKTNLKYIKATYERKNYISELQMIFLSYKSFFKNVLLYSLPHLVSLVMSI